MLEETIVTGQKRQQHLLIEYRHQVQFKEKGNLITVWSYIDYIGAKIKWS